MATASLSRSERATGIVERHELLMRDDGTWQVRDTAGSRKWHIVMDGHCDCPDYVFRHMTCKHLRAVATEERSLAQYCADWNTRSEQARADLVSNIHEVEQPAGAWYKGTYYTAEQLAASEQARQAKGTPFSAEPSPHCPDCGAPLDTRSYYVGGKGYCYVKVCTRDSEHRALPA